jgi:hypothetical protein
MAVMFPLAQVGTSERGNTLVFGNDAVSFFFRIRLLHPPAKQRQQQQHHQRTHNGTNVKILQVQRTWTYFNLSTDLFLAEASGSSQKLVPHEKGTCFWMFLHHLYCI